MPQRDSTQRDSLLTTIRTLKSDSQSTTTELERLTTKFGDVTRKLGLADASERALKLQLRSAQAATKGLKEEVARMRNLVAQTRASCANEVRKRERTIEGLKKHVGEGGRARGTGRGVGVATVTVQAGVGGGESATTSAEVGDSYDLRSETNEFLTELASGLSEDNEKLGSLLRRTVDSLKALSGWERDGQQEGGLILSTEEGHEAVAAEADNVIEHLRTLLTNPSFVPLEEVELREEEIFRLREGWERMEARWRDAIKMMDGWRKRMARTGQTINLEELRMGMSLSPVKEGDEEEEYRDMEDMEDGYEEGDTQADIDAMDDSLVPVGHVEEMSDSDEFEEDEEDLLQTRDGEVVEEDVSGDGEDYEQEQIRLRGGDAERSRLEQEAHRRAKRALEEAKEAEDAEHIRSLEKASQDEMDALMKSQEEERRLARQAKEAEQAKIAREAAAAKVAEARKTKKAVEEKKRQQREEDGKIRKQEQEKRKARQAKEAEEGKAAREASDAKRRMAQAPAPEPPKELESRKKRKSAGELECENPKKRVASQEKRQTSLRNMGEAETNEVEPAVIEGPAEASRSTRSTRSATKGKRDTPSSSPLPAPPKMSPLRLSKSSSKVIKKSQEAAPSSVPEIDAELISAMKPLSATNKFSTSQQAMQFSPIKPSSLSREYHPSPILEVPSLTPPQERPKSTHKPSKTAAKPWDENVNLNLSPAKISVAVPAMPSKPIDMQPSAKKLSANLSPSKRLAAPREEAPQQSPLTMASIAAKLAATEREADAARVRAKLKAAKASRRAGAATAGEALKEATTTTKVRVKTGETPAKVEPNEEDAGEESAARRRKPVSRDVRRSRRRSTLSPWELESLILGGVGGESPLK